MLIHRIENAENFACNRRLYIRYKITPPSSCKVIATNDAKDPQQTITSTTHATTSANRHIWRFGHDQEVGLKCSESQPSDALRITYEVISVNATGHNERIEGCTGLMIPLPFGGSTEYTLYCHRAGDETAAVAWLKRLRAGFLSFVGDARQQRRASHVDEFMAPGAKRYGVRTQFGGRIRVRMDIVGQRSAATERNAAVPVATAMGVDEVIAAYEKAKQQLLKGKHFKP